MPARVAQPGDLPAILDLLGWSFALTTDEAQRWVDRTGLANWRALRRGERVVGCLVAAPMGHFFGGRSVSARGIAGVAIAPDARGEGVASELLAATLSELASEGVALASLVPSIRRPYGKVGFEPVGTRFHYRVPTHALHFERLPMSGQIRQLTSADEKEVEELYREQASLSNGPLDRSAALWSEIRGPAERRVRGFGLREGNALDGYVYLCEHPVDSNVHYTLHVTDIGWRRRRDAENLLAFLGRHSTLATSVSWFGGPCDPLALLLPDVSYEASLVLSHWMLRVGSVVAALEGRGYPSSLECTLDLEVDDPIVPANAGRFSLRVEGGRGTVRRGGSGRMRLGVNVLASLYSSAIGCSALRGLADFDGDAESIETADRVFAGSPPWSRDAW